MMNILIISSLLQIWIFSRLQFYLFAEFCFLRFDDKTDTGEISLFCTKLIEQILQNIYFTHLLINNCYII